MKAREGLAGAQEPDGLEGSIPFLERVWKQSMAYSRLYQCHSVTVSQCHRYYLDGCIGKRNICLSLFQIGEDPI